MTERKIQDFLHFYLGQKAIHPALKNPHPISGAWLDSMKEKEIKIKPILRPLSDMTEEEARAVYTIERDRVLHETLLDFDLSRRDHGLVIHRLDDLNVSMMMGFDGVCYKVVQDYSRKTIEPALNQPLIFAYLLKQGFDLFGLLEAGIAINKAELQ